MTDQPIVAVCGFPRSGNSLVMQMLHSGGFPCVGGPPAFEDFPIHTDDWRIYSRSQGKAIKVIDAMIVVGPPPVDLPQRFVLLSRDRKEQAKSFTKFARATLDLSIGRAHEKRIARSFVKDHPRLLNMLHKRGPVLEFTFERLLSEPRWCAETLAEFVQAPLVIDAMVDRVVPRESTCFDGLLESDLLT